jgi:hypothetical protein
MEPKAENNSHTDTKHRTHALDLLTDHASNTSDYAYASFPLQQKAGYQTPGTQQNPEAPIVHMCHTITSDMSWVHHQAAALLALAALVAQLSQHKAAQQWQGHCCPLLRQQRIR